MAVNAEQTELRVSYSVGFKANMGNYESADVHFSEAETYDVAALSPEEIAGLSDERNTALREKLDERVGVALKELREA